MQTGMDQLEQYLIKQKNVAQNKDNMLLSDVAYTKLLDGIRYAGIKPGDLLSKNRISQAIGISRTPVGEAMQRLSSEGLVKILPGRTIMVAAPSMQEVLNAVYVRLQLEPKMVYLTAGRLSKVAEVKLLDTLSKMEEAAESDDRFAWSVADTIYHELLSNNCPNKFLGQIVLQARNRVLPTINDGYSDQQYVIQGTQRHREIAEAIISGDSNRAETLVSNHIELVRQNMVQRISKSW